MAGYADTRQLIIDTLMGRQPGVEIQPSAHQAFALKITDYVREVELAAAGAVPIGLATTTTVPVQPEGNNAVYLAQVAPSTTATFTNFRDQNGNAIVITTAANTAKLVTFLWNKIYWSYQETAVTGGGSSFSLDGYAYVKHIAALNETPAAFGNNAIFYFATLAGTYPNFSNLVVNAGEIAIFKSLNGQTWTKETISSISISGKADKVSGATNNNAAALDASGNLKDSGVSGAKLSKLSRLTTNGVILEGVIKTSWAALRTVKNNAQLIPGQEYEIADYETTTTVNGTRSANHLFSVIVKAATPDSFYPEARARENSNDPYFHNAGANLSKWRLWYEIENDSYYGWADMINGRGVIYRMIDEWGNDCPYDFKNIQFSVKVNADGQHDGNSANTAEFVYTFNICETFGATHNHLDLSVVAKSIGNSVTSAKCDCSCNIIKPYIKPTASNQNIGGYYHGQSQELNGVVFLNVSQASGVANVLECCGNNKIGYNCQGIRINDNCSDININDNCFDMIIAPNTCNLEIGKCCAKIYFVNAQHVFTDFVRNMQIQYDCEKLTITATSAGASNKLLRNFVFICGLSNFSTPLDRDLPYQTLVGFDHNGALKIAPTL